MAAFTANTVETRGSIRENGFMNCVLGLDSTSRLCARRQARGECSPDRSRPTPSGDSRPKYRAIRLVAAAFLLLGFTGAYADDTQSTSPATKSPPADSSQEDAPSSSDNGAPELSTAGTIRVREGLLVLYDFASPRGAVVKDRAGAGKPLDLRIDNLQGVSRSVGVLEITDKSQIRSTAPAVKIAEAVRRTGEITIEAWIRPANTKQKGPARIVTLSESGSARNFTLGQERDKYDVRLRTTSTNRNGIPSLVSKARSVRPELMHVVYTRARDGRAKIYVDGLLNRQKEIQGTTGNWDAELRLALGDELRDSRPWRGTYYLVAVYDRGLSASEVTQNFEAGAGAQAPRVAVARKRDVRAEHFETRIAPIIAQHCLECHDASTRKGALNLAQKKAALEGGRGGPILVPGDAAASALWDAIDSGDMPKDRPPLSAQEKGLVRQWIADGATWSLETIDPAVYVHGGDQREHFLRRLTVPEYVDTVRTAVGVDIGDLAEETLPPDVRADGFSNTAYNLRVDFDHVAAYARLAEVIVQRMDVMAFVNRFSKKHRFTDKDMGRLIERMGKWVLRGPLVESEVISYRGISTTVASAGGTFEEAMRLILEAMLQSPRFIYRIEDQRGDGTPLPAGEYELATRVSYIVWGAPPDRELLRIAERGELGPDSLKEQVQRMLEDPRAVEQSLRFFADWLHLDRLPNLNPDPERFPDWNPQLTSDLRDETLAFCREVVWNEKRPLTDLLNAQFTFLTPRLAKHYGVPPTVHTPNGQSLSRYDLAAIPARGGLLTHGSVLTIGGMEASTVTRGLFVFHELLRGVVKDPPPCVDATPIPTEPGLTQREIAMQRVNSKKCGGCHAKFEPLAFGLEKFDGLGSFREVDAHGNALRDDGEILFPGRAESRKFSSSTELMELLAGSERVAESLTWKLTQFALGRPLGAADASEVARIHAHARKSGGTYTSLIEAIVVSDLVRKVQTEEGTEQ